jgi:hypothetical protein
MHAHICIAIYAVAISIANHPECALCVSVDSGQLRLPPPTHAPKKQPT